MKLTLLFGLWLLSTAVYAQMGGWNGTSYDWSGGQGTVQPNGAWNGTSYDWNPAGTFNNSTPGAWTGIGYDWNARPSPTGTGWITRTPINLNSGGFRPDGNGGWMDPNGISLRPDGAGGYITSTGQHLISTGGGFVTDANGTLDRNFPNTTTQPHANPAVSNGAATTAVTTITPAPIDPNGCYCGMHNGQCMIFHPSEPKAMDSMTAPTCTVYDCQRRFGEIIRDTCHRKWSYWRD